MKNQLSKFALISACAALAGSAFCLADAVSVAPENSQETPKEVTEKTPEKAAPIAVKFALAQNISGLGRVVAFSLTASNVSGEKQTLDFNSSQSFEITATPIVGKEKAKAPVWRWSSEKIFTPALRHETMLPGESKTWTAVWQGEDNLGNPAPRGTYVLEAIVTANGGLKATPLTLEVRAEGIRETSPGKNDLDAGLNAKLETDKLMYQRGESVELKLSLKNETHQTTALTFPSGQRYDFAVRPAPKGKFDPKQKVIWQWSAGRAFTMALMMQSFAPGATLTYTETWNLKDNKGNALPAGKYAIEGMITANRGIAAPPVIIEVRE